MAVSSCPRARSQDRFGFAGARVPHARRPVPARPSRRARRSGRSALTRPLPCDPSSTARTRDARTACRSAATACRRSAGVAASSPASASTAWRARRRLRLRIDRERRKRARRPLPRERDVGPVDRVVACAQEDAGEHDRRERAGRRDRRSRRDGGGGGDAASRRSLRRAPRGRVGFRALAHRGPRASAAPPAAERRRGTRRCGRAPPRSRRDPRGAGAPARRRAARPAMRASSATPAISASCARSTRSSSLEAVRRARGCRAGERHEARVGEDRRARSRAARSSSPSLRRSSNRSWRRVSGRPWPNWTSRSSTRLAIGTCSGESDARAASAVSATAADRPSRPSLADALVGCERDSVQSHRSPQADERLLEERQRTGLAAGVRHEPLEQIRLDRDVARRRRLLDRLGEGVARERRHVDLAALDERPQRALHQLAVEVGADGEHDRGVELVDPGQRCDEPRLVVRARLREQLLELIDDEQQPARPRGGRHRLTHGTGRRLGCRRVVGVGSERLAEREHRRAPWPERADGPTRRLRTVEVGENSCFDQRRLAAARRADEAQHALRREPASDLGDLLLPAEEPRRIVPPERHHARVRARRDRVDDLLEAPHEAARRRRPRPHPRR